MAFSQSKLKPVGHLAQNFGWKGCVYGGPGTGKTPLMMTCPSAVHAFIEPGLGSVRHVVDQPGVMLKTFDEIEDYVDWCVGSVESKQFLTKTFDSFSAITFIALDEGKKKYADGRKAHGYMFDKCKPIFDKLFFAPHMHVLGICQEVLLEIEGLGKKYRPSFPGKALDSYIPHLYDGFFRLEWVPDGKGGQQRALRTRENFTAFARDRFGNLAELETPDMAYLISKAIK